MKKIFQVAIFAFAVALTACTEKKNIVNLNDYEGYLQVTDSVALNNCNKEFLFWATKNTTSQSLTYQSKIAGTYAHRFAITGKIEDVFVSDSIHQKILKADTNRTGSYQALAVNCMTRHEFLHAKKYTQRALAVGDNKASSLFILFDINMELGDYGGAKYILSKFENKNAFAYLVRAAKVDDHEGHLDVAIKKMEQALERIKDDLSLYCWTRSNLGDMYGHAGRVEDAYHAYLDVLKKNPAHDFALKGIAWIALSHDHNTALAKQIALALQTKKEMPDMHLLLAKIAEEENDIVEQKKQLQLFAQQASLAKYGNMYNKYMALLEAEEFGNPARTLEIAKVEIQNRPTPQSYDLLAWGYFQNGEVNKAVEVAQQHIEGKTFEPEALYHLGVIYKNRDNKKSKILLTQALHSTFELGPAVTTNIERYLKN